MTATRPYAPTLEALALMTRHLGAPVSLARFERAGIAGGDGSDDIESLMRRCGFNARVLQFSKQDFCPSGLPVLVQFQNQHWRLLTGWNERSCVVALPETGGGEITLSHEEFGAGFTGTVVAATPQERSRRWIGDYSQNHGTHWFWGQLRSCWSIFAEVGVAALVANALAIAIALFAMQVYDRVIPTAAFDTLWVLATGVVVAIVLEATIRVVRMNLLEHAGKRLDRQLGRTLFAQSVNLRLSHRPAAAGIMATQIREFESIREFFTTTSAAIVSDLPFVVLFLLVIAVLGGSIVWVPAAAVVLLILPGILIQPLLSRLAGEGLQESAFKNSLLLEAFEGLESVKAAGGEDRLERLWRELHDTLCETSYRLRRLTHILSQWSTVVQQMTYVGVVIAGAYLIDGGHLSVGGLVACTILVSRTIAPLSQVGGILARWQHVKAGLRSLDKLMEAPTERPVGRQFVERNAIDGNIRLEDIQWKPTPEASAGVAVSRLDIVQGEHIGILGASGAGKSSVLRLLSGLISPVSGQILVDSTNLDHIDPVDRSEQIAFLPQDVMLFNGPLRDNLDPARRIKHDNELLGIAQSIGLGDFIKALPLGLDTVIQNNRSLSGGQRQLVGLARILAQDPAIVLLDEPTSALDQRTEARVIATLQTWSKGRTLIMATHKRSMLDLVERVLVMQMGSVVMDGPKQRIDPGAQTPAAVGPGG
ncbi:type I secretion system permease/ATPase [Marinobacter fonticola]|uniref:type I secretion system permease/ATPase n=1 Tax=Marinobacter fonticola TaxID=2603215 RepID=UPI0011E80695|nr:type I secretion system permease/ATPase [Marinobacter fonticola]